MELQPCKITAAAALIFMLLLTIGGHDRQAIAGNNDGDVCSALDRSKTFRGACVSKPPCVAACGGEGYPDGYCFKDVADPGHRVCMCTGPCRPETAAAAAAAASSRGNTV